LDTVTQIAYVNGSVVVAGLSNEEFSSSLRSIPFPFQQANKGASIQIWHGSHGRFETNAPVRTFVPFMLDCYSYGFLAVKLITADMPPCDVPS
jgi:hypothetical protein